ncbi:MAG: hypothetical protein A2785_00995 [Candidatus Chisholmbacteria bacterium RIFCSPHIGHO2_01_FULL_49_18]|nr:MAG: hypothetical protein A2785_00995 [Candidatus Chisholmbacteria bacterium RIFCSPHIGHO2_01_FULL_49_18]
MPHPKEELTIIPETLWPSHLLYWRRMGSRQISEYVEQTPSEKQLILFAWGVLEAHGPFLPVANDSHLASVAADEVAHRLFHDHHIQPIIFDSFADVGSPSATWEFPGAVAYSSHPVPVIQEIWEQTLSRMHKEGFRKFFLINGDGGNWMNHWARLKWDSSVIRDLTQKHGLVFSGSNWDQEGGEPFPHAGVLDHAFIAWASRFAPERIRLSALRHGLHPVDEALLPQIDGVNKLWLEGEKRRFTDWSRYKDQKEHRGVVEFSLERYRNLLYEEDGSPRQTGGVSADFEEKMKFLMKQVLNVVQSPSSLPLL